MTDQPSDQLMDLAFFALDHGIESVAGGGPLIPFVVEESEGQRTLHRFMAGTLEDGLEQARHHVAGLGPAVTAYALAHDGYLTVQGEKSDAILVDAAERGASSAFSFAQRYRPKKGLLGKFQTVGNAALIGVVENHFT